MTWNILTIDADLILNGLDPFIITYTILLCQQFTHLNHTYPEKSIENYELSQLNQTIKKKFNTNLKKKDSIKTCWTIYRLNFNCAILKMIILDS